MSDTPAPDAVALVRGPLRPDAWYRCEGCSTLWMLAPQMAIEGVPCESYSRTIQQTHLVDLANPKLRLLGMFLDLVFSIGVIALLVLVIGLAASPWLPKDENGDVTTTAGGSVAAAMIAAFLTTWVVFEAVGRTPAKVVLGLRTVRQSDFARPGLVGILRLIAKTVTLICLGIPALTAVRDRLRRTLHDRLARTIVIHD